MIPLFITFHFVDLIDIFLVALLMYEVYRLIRGTAGMYVFLGILAFYVVWLIVRALHMEMLTRIFGQFISVGGLALVVLFQSEIRKFLTLIGNRYMHSQGRKFLPKLFSEGKESIPTYAIMEICNATFTMAGSKTGALIVLSPTKEAIDAYTVTGVTLNARISSALLQSIFFKNTTLHDGAVLIVGDKIVSAKCMLPMTKKLDLPIGLGMRHRSAIGVSEEVDVLVIVVSEQTGEVSCCQHGERFHVHSAEELEMRIKTMQESNE